MTSHQTGSENLHKQKHQGPPQALVLYFVNLLQVTFCGIYYINKIINTRSCAVSMGPEPRVVRHPRRTKAPASAGAFLIIFVLEGRSFVCILFPIGRALFLLLLTKRLPALMRKPLNQIQRRCLLTLKMEPVSLKASTGITLPALKVVLVVRAPSPASTCIALPLNWGLCPARLKATVTKFCVARLPTNPASLPRTSSGSSPRLIVKRSFYCTISPNAVNPSPSKILQNCICARPAADCLLRAGFVDETVGDYIHCSLSISKDGIRQALVDSGLDAPANLFGKTSRWAKIQSHIQSLYESNPEEISSHFVVLSATALTKANAYVITRYLSPILWPTDQQTLFEL